MSDETPPRGPSEEPERSGPPDPDAGYPGMGSTREIDALALVISGPVLFGGIGWLLDHFLHTAFLLPVGIVGGMVLSLYLIWVRYSTH
jgi:hypothetical protein